MMSIISMLIIRAAHDKFLFVFKSMIIRIPTALCIPIGCALIDNVIGNSDKAQFHLHALRICSMDIRIYVSQLVLGFDHNGIFGD